MVNITDYDTIKDIPLSSKVVFQEFVFDRHQIAKKSLEIRGELQRIIKDNEGLSNEEIEQYYPEVTQVEDIVALSVYPFYRLVLVTGTSQLNLPVYKVIHLNKYFIHAGMQKLQYEEGYQPVSQSVPQGILGYDSYQIGQKFKK
jgi:hypothetical protein